MKFPSRCLLLSCLSLAALSGAGPVFSQTAAPSARAVPTDLTAKLQESDKRLTSIEEGFTRMEALKTIGDKFGDDLNEPLAAYARGMSESFDAAMKQAELAARSQGKDGSIASIKMFEDLAKKHESRLKQLDGKGQKIVQQVKDGTVEIDKSLIEQATPQDRAEFLQSLSAGGRKSVLQKHPDLFKGLPETLPWWNPDTGWPCAGRCWRGSPMPWSVRPRQRSRSRFMPPATTRTTRS
jgi:hypothetical protein